MHLRGVHGYPQYFREYQEVSGDSGGFRGVSGYPREFPKGSKRTRGVQAVSGAPHFNTGGFHGSFRKSQARFMVLRGF